MKDIGIQDMAHRRWVQGKILETLTIYGFQHVEPSPIESLETLEAKCGPAIKDEIYWFEDKAKRRLGLRFDLTVGIARMVAARQDWATPIKLAAVSNMWRYDEPQFGRYRCFYQWDAEIFGSSEVVADAEIIALGIDVLKKFKLPLLEARISSRNLAEGFLNHIGVGDGGLEALLRIMDKYSKLGQEAFADELDKAGLNKAQTEEMQYFLSIRGDLADISTNLKELTEKNEKTRRGVKELQQLAEALEAMGKLESCVFDMSVVRGIGYYDGIVFEIYDKSCEKIGAVVGGGRFDKLCGIFGKPLPATGVAGGIERLMLSLEKANLIPPLSQAPKVLVAAAQDVVRRKVLEIVDQLRGDGISADFDVKTRSLKRQLEYADSLGIPFTIIIGPRELEKGKVRLRDMRKRKEEEITLKEAEEKLKVEL